MDVSPLDLEVVRHATVCRITKGELLFQTDRASADQVGDLGQLVVKQLLDKRERSKWQLKWNKSGAGRTTYEYVKNVYARGNFVVGFGFKMGFLLAVHGSPKEFPFLRSELVPRTVTSVI